MLVHEFITHKTTAENHKRNETDLLAFINAISVKTVESLDQRTFGHSYCRVTKRQRPSNSSSAKQPQSAFFPGMTSRRRLDGPGPDHSESDRANEYQPSPRQFERMP